MAEPVGARVERTRPDERTRPERGYRGWVPQDGGRAALEGAQYRVALLLLRYASLANVLACFEDLMAVNPLADTPPERPMFAPRLVASDPTAFRSLTGAHVVPHEGLLPDLRYDAVIVPVVFDAEGSLSERDAAPLLSADERDWLRDQHRGGALISTMCSGSFAMAEAGLLDGHACSVIPLYAHTFRARFPAVTPHTNRTIVVSGERRELVTGGHAVYSADVSLYTVARFCGAPMAVLLADLYGKSWETPLDGAAFSSQADGVPALEDATVRLARRFIAEHLSAPGLVQAAAELAHVSERTLRRRFLRSVGLSPRDYVRHKRMEHACDLLARSRLPIEEVATRVGYADRSAFARAFRELEGLTPADYRRRFHQPVRLRRASGGR